MNKILNINLGGYALTIDDDAYEYLSAYLESIRKRFSESEGRDEILSDIEARLGELITQQMGTRTIVMLPDVEEAAAIMGKPEDFGGEDRDANAGSSPKGTGAGKSAIRTGKRLFRDEEDSVVAGVCSGLAAYFGIQDPVWMRLIFVLLGFISFGFWAPAYVLMWILVPPARSAADRLAMRGEQINMDNIAREVEGSFERIGKKVNELGADAAKKGGAAAPHAVSTGVTAIGQAFGFLLRFIAKFAALIILLIVLAIFFGVGAAWMGSVTTLFVGAPYIEYFSPLSKGWTWFAVVTLFFLFSIPAIALVLFFSRLLFKTRTPSWASSTLTALFVLSVIAAFAFVPFVAKEYSHTSTLSKNIDLSALRSDTLRVAAAPGWAGEAHESDGFHFDDEDLRLGDDGLEMKCPLEIRVAPSRDGRFHATQIIKAQGSSNLQAQENADQVAYEVSFRNNTLWLPTSYKIPKGKKWKVQRLRINIEVPTGGNITFDEKIYKSAGADLEEYDDQNRKNYISRRPGRVFRMGPKGIICTDCPNIGDRGYRSDRDYEHFILEGDFVTEIRRGDEFRVEIDGPKADKDKVQKIETGDKLTFTTNGKSTNGSVKIIVETPTFSSLHSLGSGEVTIRGFDESEASIRAAGNTRLRAYMDVSAALDLVLSGEARVELTGKGGYLGVSMGDNSVLEAANWTAERIEVTAYDAARARVFAKEDALVLSKDRSSVRVDGGAEVRSKRD